MNRSEFSKQVRRDALKRSGGFCEGVGELYGVAFGTRCNAPLSYGVEFDHWPIAATEPDCTGLDNCVAVCPTCHSYKTRKYDIPAQAKSKRVRDKHQGIRKASSMRGPGFKPAAPQRKATTPLTPKFDGDICASRKAR
jgi:5-methylcytosine-specific restriction protein A